MIHKFITTILFLTFSYSAFAQQEKPLPFWLAEKDDKKVYLLGTIHTTGLNSYQCPSEIKNRVKNSDLVFVETNSFKDYNFNREEQRILFIGSESQKQELLSKLPEEDRIAVSKAVTNIVKSFDMINRIVNQPVKYASGGFSTFENLNPQTQEFLINHSFKPSKYNKKDFLKEVAYFILLIVYYDASFDVDSMDSEIALFSKNNKIPLKGLDKDKKLISEKEFQDAMSKKDTIFVTIDNVEQTIANYELFKEQKSSIIKFSTEYFLNKISQGNFKEIEQTIDGKNALLKNRNIIWVEKINQALNTEENNTIFVAGGILHFLGSDNMIDMLKEEGFNIKKLHCSLEFEI